MASQSLSIYTLRQCIVSAAQFASGELSFFDVYAELTATDAEGNSTSPLRLAYEALEHFRIVRAQGVMRLTLPHRIVQQWASQNAFASQLDAYVQSDPHGEATVRGGSTTAHLPAPSATLFFQLEEDDMAHFLKSIAPLIAASRRTRSVSRISMTEPLPAGGGHFDDPAASVGKDTFSSATVSSSRDREGVEEERGSDDSTAAAGDGLCRDSRERFQRWGPQKLPTNAETEETAAVAVADASLIAGTPEFVNTACDRLETAAGASCYRSHPSNGKGLCVDKESAAIGDVDHKAEASPAAAPKGTAASIERPETHHTSSTPPQDRVTRREPPYVLESVAEELAELLEETAEPGLHLRNNGRPLQRAPVFEERVAIPPDVCTGPPKGTLCGGPSAQRRQKGKIVPAIPSICPSLRSSCSGRAWHQTPARQKSTVPQKGCRRVRELSVAAMTRGGRAHLCASELSSTSTAALPRLCAGDRGGANQEGIERSPRSPVIAKAGASATPAVAGAVAGQETIVDTIEKTEVGAESPSWGAPAGEALVTDAEEIPQVPDQRSENAHNGELEASADCGQEERTVVAAACSLSQSSRSSSRSASSFKLGDLLCATSENWPCSNTSKAAAIATEEAQRPQPTSSATGGSRRKCSVLRSGGITEGQPQRIARKPVCSGGIADMEAYLMDLFPPRGNSIQPRQPRRHNARAASGGAAKSARTSKAHNAASDGKVSNVPLLSPTRTSTRDEGCRAAAVQSLQDSPFAGEKGPASPIWPRISSLPESHRASTPGKENNTAQTRLNARKKRARSTTEGPAASKRGISDANGIAPAATRGQPDTHQEFAAADAQPTMDAAANADPSPPRQSLKNERMYVGVADARAFDLVQESHVPPQPPNLNSRRSGSLTAADARTRTRGYEDDEEAAAVTRLPTSRPATAADAGTHDGRSSPEHTPHCRTSITANLNPPMHMSDVKERDPADLERGVPPELNLLACAGADWSKECGQGSFNAARALSRCSRGSSEASCPLYCHDSRKERTRRAVRYMNLISRNLSALHETHDALRGLLLTMMADGQL